MSLSECTLAMAAFLKSNFNIMHYINLRFTYLLYLSFVCKWQHFWVTVLEVAIAKRMYKPECMIDFCSAEVCPW